jgi:ribosomal protein S19
MRELTINGIQFVEIGGISGFNFQVSGLKYQLFSLAFRRFIVLPSIILQNFLTTDGHGWTRIIFNAKAPRMQRRKVVTHLFRCFIILPSIILQGFLTTDGHGWTRIIFNAKAPRMQRTARTE